MRLEKRLRLSLRQKVATVIVASYLLLAFFFILPTVIFRHYLLERELVAGAILFARPLAEMSKNYLQRNEEDSLRAFLRMAQEKSAGWVRYIVVQDKGGRVVEKAGEETPPLPAFPLDGNTGEETVWEVGERNPLWHHLFGYIFEISVPFGRAGAPEGRVRLGISTSDASREMRQVTLISLGISAVAILLSVVVAWAVDRRIRTSLSHLMGVTRRLAEGDLSRRVDIRTGDELEELGHSFNWMANELARYQSELEEKVAERTRELAETNDALKRIQTEQIRYERLSVLGEMTAVVSHEVRTPLNAMSIHLQRLKRKFGHADPGNPQEFIQILDLIAFEIHRVNNVIKEYMRFARPHIGRTPNAEINAVVQSVIHLLDLEAARARVRVDFRPTKGLPPIPLDEDKLRQIFLNLLLNSIQAMSSGGRITIETGLAEDRRVRALVADTGPGIPQGYLDKIFQPFFTTKPEGTGLGLAIVSRIMREVGGEIHCLSERDQGAEFEMTFPAAGSESGKGRPSTDDARENSPKGRMLL